MEKGKGKQSKKKIYYKIQKPESDPAKAGPSREDPERAGPSRIIPAEEDTTRGNQGRPNPGKGRGKKKNDWKQGRKNHGESREDFNQQNALAGQDKRYAKRHLQQPKARLGDLDDIWKETRIGKDFESLLTSPLSTGYFQFASEKKWVFDSTKYGDFFLVDLDNLSTMMNCVPFNQLIGLGDEYFTKDELTYINSTAEISKKSYDAVAQSTERENLFSDSDSCLEYSDSSKSAESRDPQESATMMNDLEALLALKGPVRVQPVPVNVGASAMSDSDETRERNIPVVTKSIDLESWLDLVLDE